jgi:hypothetical protein
MDVRKPSILGTVTFDEAETVQSPSPRDPHKSVTITRAYGRWTPSERVARFCSKDFCLPLDRVTGADGVRRIFPACSWDELIEMGFVAGLAIVHDINGYSQEQDELYSLMFRILQFARGRPFRGRRGMKEHLTRKFAYSRDLYRAHADAACGKRNCRTTAPIP